MFAPSSPVTGTAQTGLTTPTYTLTADQAPNNLGKQYAVTALGGTQTGVEAHSVSAPFTITMFRPATFKQVGRVNPVTGALAQQPMNTWKIIARKGVIPLSGQAYQQLRATLSIEVPAGADLADPESVRAALSLLFGTLNSSSAAIGDTIIGGVL